MTFRCFLPEGLPLGNHMQVAIPYAVVLRDLTLFCQFINHSAVVYFRCADHLHLESHLLFVRLSQGEVAATGVHFHLAETGIGTWLLHLAPLCSSGDLGEDLHSLLLSHRLLLGLGIVIV